MAGVSAPVSAHPRRPRHTIVVDLDGTLVFTDTFISCLLEVFRRRPEAIGFLVRSLARGRSFCKVAAASLAPIDALSLPYNWPLIDYLKQRRAAGLRVILATGAASEVAQQVADHLGIFDHVIATTPGRNVVGEEKARAIQEAIGDEPFTYAGNSHADLRVWGACRNAIMVDARGLRVHQLQQSGIRVRRVFTRAQSRGRELLSCLRPHQWSKNMLVFVAALLAHQIANPAALWHAVVAFAALCFSASGLYIANDLLDLQADRRHPSKRRRALASGNFSIPEGAGLSAASLACAGILCLLLPPQGKLLLAVYAAGSLSYSLVLKRVLFLDVVSLALLYALRVLYGGAATGIHISVWTLAFSLFLFTGLATVKRLGELRKAGKADRVTEEYRGYRHEDASQLSSLASASALVGVLVLALYINSPEVALLYRRPQGLWLLCPILIYWIGRLTLIANRGELDYDPVAFALRDKPTWLAGVLVAIVLAVSTLG